MGAAVVEKTPMVPGATRGTFPPLVIGIVPEADTPGMRSAMEGPTLAAPAAARFRSISSTGGAEAMIFEAPRARLQHGVSPMIGVSNPSTPASVGRGPLSLLRNGGGPYIGTERGPHRCSTRPHGWGQNRRMM